MTHSNYLRERAYAFLCGMKRPTAFLKKRTKTRSTKDGVCARLHRGEEGNAILEFALVLPPLLFVLMGIFVLGIIYNNYLMLTSATGAGAQQLQQLRGQTSDPCADTYNALVLAAPTLNSSNITLTFNFGGTTESGKTCASGAAIVNGTSASGMQVTVNSSYPCNFVIMGINFAPGGCTLKASATEYLF
jgi:Flp pilus assembly protein TadG